MKAGYPPIDIKFTDRVAYYNAFDEYYVNHNLNAMEKLFAGYVNTRLDSYLAMLEEWKYCGGVWESVENKGFPGVGACRGTGSGSRIFSFYG